MLSVLSFPPFPAQGLEKDVFMPFNSLASATASHSSSNGVPEGSNGDWKMYRYVKLKNGAPETADNT